MSVVSAATSKLRDEHFRVVKLQLERSNLAELPAPDAASTTADQPVLPFDESFIFGAPVPTNSKRSI